MEGWIEVVVDVRVVDGGGGIGWWWWFLLVVVVGCGWGELRCKYIVFEVRFWYEFDCVRGVIRSNWYS